MPANALCLLCFCSSACCRGCHSSRACCACLQYQNQSSAQILISCSTTSFTNSSSLMATATTSLHLSLGLQLGHGQGVMKGKGVVKGAWLMEWEMAGNCRLCHYQSYRHRHRSSTTNYTFLGHGCEPKCYFLMVFPPPPSPSTLFAFLYPHSFTHTHSTPRQLHVILSFDVFGGLMSIPCAGSSGTSHRQIVVPPPCCCTFLLLYFLLLYSFLLLLLCLCWKTNITIIILTTISGICASVERNERQNETQLETRRDVGQAVEKR